MKTKKDGWSKWYAKHKASVLNRKKERYAEDKAYRESVKARGKAKYRDDRGILPNGSRIVTSEGRKYVGLKFYTAAARLRSDVRLLRYYRSKEYFPEMKFEDTKLRLITVDQIPILRDFLRLCKKVGPMQASKLMNGCKVGWRKNSESKKIIAQEKRR